MIDLAGCLVGAWRLRAYEDRDSVDSRWTQTYGPEPLGLIIYDRSGWMSVQVVGKDALDAYFGRFHIMEASEDAGVVGGIVVHQVVGTSMPDLLTADQTRPFR